MTKLRFTDGQEFDLSGKLHKEHRPDGWYIVGNGMLIPANDETVANEYIRNHSKSLSEPDPEDEPDEDEFNKIFGINK